MSIRLITEFPRQGGRSGPFARLWAKDAEVCIAFDPGHRVSADISGRTTLEVMPSGVFYPTVDNQYAGDPDRFLYNCDNIALQTKGYGPIKIRPWINPMLLVHPPEKDTRPTLLEGYPPQWLKEEAEEICCVVNAVLLEESMPHIRAIGATCLALYDVTDESVLENPPLPVVMYTTKKLPMKVRLP